MPDLLGYAIFEQCIGRLVSVSANDNIAVRSPVVLFPLGKSRVVLRVAAVRMPSVNLDGVPVTVYLEYRPV